MKQKIPNYTSIEPAEFRELFDRFFANGGLRRVVLGLESGCPLSRYISAGITLVPFVVICAEGTIDLRIMRDGDVWATQLNPHEGVFMSPGTWLQVDHRKAPLYFRVTMDEDHTLFGLDEYDYLTGPWIDGLKVCIGPPVQSPDSLSLIRRLQSPSGPRQNEWACAAANLLLVELAKLLDLEREPTSRAHALWTSICTYLNEHSHHPLNRENVAEVFGITQNHLSRLFRQQGTQGFQATLEEIRMNQAMEMLKTPDLRIAEIAHGCGFKSPAYFIRVFRERFGSPPGEYRNSHMVGGWQ